VEPEPKIAIVIPTRDLAKVTGECLKSIYKKTTYSNYEVIVVDNGSRKKETIKMFDAYKAQHGNFRVIRADMEFNYAKLNNLAVKETDAEYILLLNNDIEVITPEWLEIMVGYAMQKHVGAVGAKLLYPDNTVQHGGVIMGLGIASHAFTGIQRNEIVWGGRLTVPYNYSAVTAACLMVSKEKWNEVGGLEEKLKVAYNDVDFCLKLLEKGYYNVLVPMVELYHYESKSRGAYDTPEKKKRFDWEQDFMREKWAKRIREDEFYNPNYTKQTWYMLDKGKKDGGKK
jgi:GT2 family glycosyltransferase